MAFSQRLCPVWRTAFFDALARRASIELTVFYGRGSGWGASQNARDLGGKHYKRLWAVRIPYISSVRQTLRVVHPGLLWHLLWGRFDVVVVEGSTNLINDLQVLLYCFVSGSGLVWSEYGAPDGYTRLRRLAQPAVHLLRLQASAHIAYFSDAKRELVADGVSPALIVRVPNTIDVRAERLHARAHAPRHGSERARWGIGPDEFVVAYIGALEGRKRVGNLLNAVEGLRGAGLAVRGLVIGDGPDAAVLENRAGHELHDAIVFVGRRDADSTLFLGMSDVVVLPGEGGQAIPHAFSCGKPVIATSEAWVGGSSVYDYMDDGVEGFVVARNDVQALMCVLQKLIADRSMCAAMGAAAANRANRLTMEDMVKGVERAIFIAARRPSVQC